MVYGNMRPMGRELNHYTGVKSPIAECFGNPISMSYTAATVGSGLGLLWLQHIESSLVP